MAQVTLGDVAIESRETYKGDKSGMPIVGLEHLIPEDVVLSLWDRDKENTFTKMFRKGDMLFGRRRAYLKKAAQAPFDGICSGDITVIRAKEDRLIPELLPFIIQNDVLFDFAVGKSAGSLSPRVKWENLKNYKFELPPLPEQKKLAEALWAINDTLQAYQKLLIETDELVKSQFIEMFGNPIMKEKDESLPTLGEVCILKAGKFVKADSIKEKQEDGLFPCFGGNGLRGYVPSFNQEGEFPLIGRQGALCGNVQYAVGKFHATEHAVVVTPNIEMDRFWLYHLLCLLDLNRYASGAAQPGLAVNKLEAIRVFVPDLQLQKQYSEFAKQSDKSKFALQNAISAARETKRSIIADALGIKGKE